MAFHRKIFSLLSDRLQKATTFNTAARPSVNMEERLSETGNFTYHEDGFEYLFKDGPIKIKWSDISSLTGYKIDLFTTDEICLDIVWQGYQMTITEETPGWYQFVERTKAIFPDIPKDWDINIIHPAFAENRTVIYQRESQA